MEMSKIKIPKDIIDAMIEQAYDELPNETCGLLSGTDYLVQTHYKMANIDQSPEHFSFDPKEQFQVLKNSRKSGQKIIANFHSHPKSPARPSEEDIRLANDPNIIYIIISLAEETPVVKAFVKEDDTLVAYQLEITD